MGTRKDTPTEGLFKKKVTRDLNEIQDLYYFVKEAMALRGIPDIIGCSPYSGFFAWELKRSKSEVYYSNGKLKLKGRTKLQWYHLQQIRRAGGIGRFVYPENYQECLEELLGIN